ncbi:MAG: methyl-accepting chemotaxis protein, partial [Lachnospiraceae bacterium]|nr:methyl-accepting chemotaxis protein [Lachnospiraceae bacterium]
MGFLKNLSVRIKLLILTVPFAVALIVSCVVMGIELNSTEDEVAGIFYDILYTANNSLVSADRDYYQAVYAATQYYDLSHGYSDAPEASIPEYLKTNLEDYEKNCTQVLANIEAAMEAAKKNEVLFNQLKSESGHTFAAAEEEFINDFNKWKGLYDLESGSGDWNAYIEEFRLAREAIDELQGITEEWAVEEHKAIQDEIRVKIIGLSAVFGVLIIVLIFIAVLIIKGIRNGVRLATDSLNELAAGNLAVELPDESLLGNDEIGQMQKATGKLTSKLRDIMSRSNEMARDLSSAGSDLASSSDQASQASGQVTIAVDEISQGAVSQAESVEHAAGNTNDIGNDIEVIAGNVEQLD